MQPGNDITGNNGYGNSGAGAAVTDTQARGSVPPPIDRSRYRVAPREPEVSFKPLDVVQPPPVPPAASVVAPEPPAPVLPEPTADPAIWQASEVAEAPAAGDTLEAESTELESGDTPSGFEAPLGDEEPPTATVSKDSYLSPFRYNKTAFLITGAAILVVLLIGAGSWLLSGKQRNDQANLNNASQYATGSELQLNDVKGNQQLKVGSTETLAVNGELRANDTLVVSPTSQPQNPSVGQIYYDKATNAPYYYNGKGFVALGAGVTSLGGATGAITLGNGLGVTNGQLSLSNAVLQQIASTRSGVASLQGQAGNLQLVSGSGITINGLTISNSGALSLASGSANLVVVNNGGRYTITDTTAGSAVTSITGTPNQIIASSSTGNVTLSLPQDIAVTSAPRFGGLNLGAPGSVTGTLSLANATNSNLTVLQSAAPSQSQTIIIPDANASSDQVCLVALGNCAGSGGGVVGSGTPGHLSKFNGTGSITDSNLTESGNTLTYAGNVVVNASAGFNGNLINLEVNGSSKLNVNEAGDSIQAGTLTVNGTGASSIAGSLSVGTGLTVTTGGANITGDSVITGQLTGLTGLTSAGTITFSGLNTAGVVHTNASGVLSTGPVVLGADTSGNYVAQLGTLTGLTTTGNTGAGSTPTLSVNYGTVAGTAVQGNTTLICSAGTGNLTGGGNTLTLGAGGTCGDITITNSPTFSGTLAVQGTGGITVGVPGTTAGVLNLANGTNSNLSVLSAAAPTGSGNATYTLPSIAGGSSDEVCLVILGNCAGSGGGVTGSGTPGHLSKFSGTGSITDSGLTESGSTLTYSGNLVIQGSNSLSLGTAASTTGAITFNNGVNSNTLTLQAGATGGNLTLTLPTADGANGNCLLTNGAGALSFGGCTGGAGGGVTSIDGLTGVLTLANSSGAGSTITINDASTSAKGIAQFNSTNFTASAGTINTIQDISTTATPTFGGLTLNSPLSVSSGGTGVSSFTPNGILYGNGSSAIQVTAAAANSVLITGVSNVPTLSQTLPVAVQTNITHTGSLIDGSIASGFGNISTGNLISTSSSLHGGTLSVGGSNQFQVTGLGDITTSGALSVNSSLGISVGVAGSATGALKLYNGTNTNASILQPVAPTGSGSATYNLPSIAGGSSDDLCLKSLGNCAGSGGVIGGGGTLNHIAKFSPDGSHIADSNLTESGTTLSYAGNAVVNAGSGFVGNLINLEVNGSSKLSVSEAGNSIQAGTLTVNGTGASSIAGTLSVGTLGTNGNTSLCSNAGQLSTCASTGTQGFWTRTGTTLQPANAGDSVIISGTLTGQNTIWGTRTAATNAAFAATVTGDAFSRYQVLANGTTQWGGGTVAADIVLSRSGAGALQLQPTSGNDSTKTFQVQNAGGASLINVNSQNKIINVGGTLATITITPAVPPSGGGTVGTWGTTTALPTAVYGASTVAYNGYMYQLGGYNGSAGIANTYSAPINGNGTLGSWTARTALPTTLYNATAVVYNGYVYVMGGYTGSSELATVYYAQLNNGVIGTWNTTTSLPSTRQLASSSVNNGYVYILAGSTGGVAGSSVNFAQINANGTLGTWYTATSLPAARAGASSIVNNGYIYELGGGTSPSCSPNGTNTVYYASINADGTISGWTTDSANLGDYRFGAGTVAWGGYAYELGGVTSGGGCVPAYLYHYASLNGDGSTDSASSWAANSAYDQVWQAGVVAYNGYAYMLGGTTNGTTNTTNTVAYVSLSGSQGSPGGQTVNPSDGNAVNYTQEGNSLFQNATDSATSFQIQNSSAVNLFTVDTLNNRVIVGTPSNTPTLLMLGTKNTLGDPTCVSGGIYYNSSTNQAKVCLGGSWAAVGVPTVTSLPVNPADGDEVYYKVYVNGQLSGNTGYWHLRYNASTGYWDFLGGPALYSVDPVVHNNATATYTASSAYTYLPLNGDYDVSFGSQLTQNQVNALNQMDVQLYYNTTSASPCYNIAPSIYIGSAISCNFRLSGVTGAGGTAAYVQDRYASDSAQSANFYPMFVKTTPVRVK